MERGNTSYQLAKPAPVRSASTGSDAEKTLCGRSSAASISRASSADSKASRRAVSSDVSIAERTCAIRCAPAASRSTAARSSACPSVSSSAIGTPASALAPSSWR